MNDIKKLSLMEKNMICSMSTLYPYSENEVEMIYMALQSFDKTIEVLAYAWTFGFSLEDSIIRLNPLEKVVKFINDSNNLPFTLMTLDDFTLVLEYFCGDNYNIHILQNTSPGKIHIEFKTKNSDNIGFKRRIEFCKEMINNRKIALLLVTYSTQTLTT